MRIRFSTPLARAIVAGLLLSSSLSAKPLAKGASAQTLRDETGEGRQLRASISTSFGIYQPYAVPRYRVSVGQGEPAITSNFSNIAIAEQGFSWNNFFSSGERSMLQKNGFVVRPEAIASFGQAYSPETSSHDLGSFITIDAMLHGLRISLAEATRDMERNYAAPNLTTNLATLSGAINKQLAVERNPALSESLVRLLGYVQTAQALLSPSAQIDQRVQSQVSAELRKIRAASGESQSSLFPQQTINYSLFAPSGYYTLDNQLSNYYRAKVWLSRVGFSLKRENGGLDLQGVRTAALLGRMIDGLDDNGDFKQTLRNINEPSAFLSGGADRLAPWDILVNAMRGYYGRIVDAGPGFLADDQQMAAFIGYLSEQLPEEQANDRSVPTFRLVEWDPAASGRELFEQVSGEGRAALGSYGMTLMAAMGNVPASELLGARSSYARGGSSLSGNRPAETWVQDMDHTILYTIQPLLLATDRDERYPRFMRSDAWRSRELNSALGAWADYRHAPGTMQMQSVVKAGSVGSAGSELATTGYVEPNPEAWARVASLAKYLRSGLSDGRGDRLINRKVEAKLQDIETAAAKLMQIAALELDGKELSADQLDLIKSMPQRIAAYETFTDKSLQGDGYMVNAGAAEFADGGVANGHPMMAYVIVPRNDGEEGLMLTRGAVYSYYEVRASDQSWRDQISTPGASVSPDMKLVGSFVSAERGFAQDPDKFLGVSAVIPATARYTPTKTEQIAAMSHAELALEKSVVSRGTTDELWFTVHAPNMEGQTLAVSIANTGGQSLGRMEIGRIKNGERLDVIRVSSLGAGQYFIRVEDLAGNVVATSRFLVTK